MLFLAQPAQHHRRPAWPHNGLLWPASSAAILAAPTGEQIDIAQFPTSSAGLARAIDWVAHRTGADLTVLWVVEGTATYGTRLVSAAANAGYQEKHPG